MKLTGKGVLVVPGPASRRSGRTANNDEIVEPYDKKIGDQIEALQSALSTNNIEKESSDDGLVDTDDETNARTGKGDDNDDDDMDDDDKDAGKGKLKESSGCNPNNNSKKDEDEDSDSSGGSRSKSVTVNQFFSESADEVKDTDRKSSDDEAAAVTKETDCSNEGCEIDERVPLDEDHRCTVCEYNYFHDGGCCKVVTIDDSTFKMCIPCCDNGERIEKVECANPRCKVKEILVTREASACPFCDKFCHFDCFLSVIDKSETTTHACPGCVKEKDLELILADTREENKVKGKKAKRKTNPRRKSARKKQKTKETEETTTDGNEIENA